MAAGLTGALNPAALAFAGALQSLSHAAYLSGLLLGIGLGFWSLVPAIERQTRAFTLLTAIVVVGGLARLVLALRLGVWTGGVAFPLVMELLVTPALCLWQRRLFHFAP